MKPFIITLLANFTFLICFSQTSIDSSKHLKLKKGIYLSFDQINTDNPAITESFIVKERSNGNIILVGGGKYTFELSADSKSDFKKIRKEFVAISDGNNFFISDKITVKGWLGMTPYILTGPWIIADTHNTAAQYTGGGLIPSLTNINSGLLVNIQTGGTVSLTKKTLKEMMKKYPAIQEKYKNKMDITEFSAEIIDEINTAEKSK